MIVDSDYLTLDHSISPPTLHLSVMTPAGDVRAADLRVSSVRDCPFTA